MWNTNVSIASKMILKFYSKHVMTSCFHAKEKMPHKTIIMFWYRLPSKTEAEGKAVSAVAPPSEEQSKMDTALWKCAKHPFSQPPFSQDNLLWWTISRTGFSKHSGNCVFKVLKAAFSDFHASSWVKVVCPVHWQVQISSLYNSRRFLYSLWLIKETLEENIEANHRQVHKDPR